METLALETDSCRFCLKYSDELKMCEIEDVGDYMRDLIKCSLHIEISHEDKLRKICELCLSEIETVFEIYTKFQEYDVKFKSMISTVKDDYFDESTQFEDQSDEDIIFANADELEDSITINVIDEEEESQVCPAESSDQEVIKTIQIPAEKKRSRNKHKDSPKKVETPTNKCYICGEVYESKEFYINHFPVHYGDVPYTCELCDNEVLITVKGLNNHLALHDKERPYQCKYCVKRFTTETNRSSHQRKYCRKNENMKKLAAKTALLKVKKRPQCAHCGKFCSNNYDLKSHESSHTGASKCECKVCGKSFTHRKNLTRHERIHTGEKPYKCDLCDKAFKQSGEMQDHRRLHTGEKPYECSFCNMTFRSASQLSNHRKTHIGTATRKSFNDCNYCSLSFQRHSDLIGHLETVHSDQKLEIVTCELCSKKWTNPSRLKSHMYYTHINNKKFKCSFCDNLYSTSVALADHENVHTGERPHKCKICDKSFAKYTSMTRHEKLHSGVKPFKCDLCEKAFSRLYSMQIHRKTHNTRS